MMEGDSGGGCFRLKLIEYHDYRTLMGPCLVSFSIPLLIPGVVLTIVGSYGNAQTFARFGGWHITGIVILSLAIVMLFIGIVLKCCFRPVLGADIEQHLSPTHSMISGKHNLAYENDRKIYSSSSFLKGSSKVGHRDGHTGNDVIVSTHDTRDRKENIANGRVTTKGLPNNNHKGKSAQNGDPLSVSNKKTNQRHEPEVLDGVTHLPEMDTFNGPVKKHRHKRTDSDSSDKKRSDRANASTIDTQTAGVKTKVTATVVAEAETETTPGNRSRDLSSDANENSQFLPPLQDESVVKRRKKKKKKRHRKTSSNDQHDITNVSVTDQSGVELPDLRVKPVLVHDGSYHHALNQHVHFGGVQEAREGSEADVESDSQCSDR